MASLLDKLETIIKNKAELSKRSQQSADWFRRKLRALRGPIRYTLSGLDANKFYADIESRGKRAETAIGPGSLFCYKYNAKHKLKLSYYDEFPLVLILGMSNKGFYGMNFHYLPPQLRAKLLDQIDKLGRDKIDWNSLSNIALVRPTVKRYLFSHVASNVIPIDDEEKEITIFLPIEKFTTSKNIVWKDSAEIINRFKRRA